MHYTIYYFTRRHSRWPLLRAQSTHTHTHTHTQEGLHNARPPCRSERRGVRASGPVSFFFFEERPKTAICSLRSGCQFGNRQPCSVALPGSLRPCPSQPSALTPGRLRSLVRLPCSIVSLAGFRVFGGARGVIFLINGTLSPRPLTGTSA